MYWDRFDICEAWNLLAHDYGLYDVKDRLNRLEFKCAPSAEFYEGLGENSKVIYDYNAARLDACDSRIKSLYNPFPQTRRG